MLSEREADRGHQTLPSKRNWKPGNHPVYQRSWGAGKTHFFRLFREVAFQSDCLVSNVELNANDAALNKFQLIFYAIVGNIITPTYYAGDENPEGLPFGTVVRESSAYLATGEPHHCERVFP